MQPENLSLGLGAKRHANRHCFNLFGERFELRLLLLDLAAHIAQLLTHLKRVLDGVRALHDGKVLRFFAPNFASGHPDRRIAESRPELPLARYRL